MAKKIIRMKKGAVRRMISESILEYFNGGVEPLENAEGTQGISGDFKTEYIYSSFDDDSYYENEPDENGVIDKDKVAMSKAKSHVKYLITHGLDVQVTNGRFAVNIDIHYEGQEQYNALCLWLAWDLGMTNSILKTITADQMAEVKKVIASGSNRMYEETVRRIVNESIRRIKKSFK